MSNNNLPLVSIITPSYNSMPFIEETILSVKNQDYDGDIEHIIFDANSRDGTVEAVQKFDNIIFISEPDSGQSDAINKGFDLARGEIIGWINSDDFYEVGIIKKVVKFFLDNPKTDMIHGDTHIVDESSVNIGITFGYNIKNPIDLLRNNAIKQPTIFMRKKIINNLKGVDKKLHWTMDRELWLRILLNGYNVVYLKNLRIANFRVCEGRKSHDNPDKMIEEWINVIQNYFNEGVYFPELNKKVKNSIINKKKSDYHLAKMNMCFEESKKLYALKNFLKSIFYNIKIALNIGLWKNLISGLIGFKINKYGKFKKNKIKQNIIRDYQRYKTNKPSLKNFLILFISKVGFRAVVLYRLSRYFLYHSNFKFLASLLLRLMRHLCHCYINPTAEIGPGFLISHVGSIVIGSNTRIGKNCDIRQSTTFGGNFNKKDKNGRTKPWVGDNVSVGAGAVIIGPVNIGDHSIIGANSVVTKDIPSNVIASGIPAKVIKKIWSEDSGRKL